jgi:hypothetical protein
MEKPRHLPPGAASMADFLNPNLNLSTRTWLLIAETRDQKTMTPASFPVSGLPLSSVICPTANRLPPTASPFHFPSLFP